MLPEEEKWLRGYRYIAGIDEVGRGSLAGPVAAAAVILSFGFRLPGIDDSKRLSPKKRERFFEEISREALAVGIGIVDSQEIDKINILQASLRAMAEAVEKLSPPPDFLLIDGIFQIPSPFPQICLPKGEGKSPSIAAASIVAKVTRDRLMLCYHKLYPQYHFAQNKGYGTPQHLAAIANYGLSPLHRKTFKGVREYLSE